MTRFAYLLILVAAASAADVRTNLRRSKVAKVDIQRTKTEQMASAFRDQALNGDERKRRLSAKERIRKEDDEAEEELWNELLETANKKGNNKSGSDRRMAETDRPVTEIQNEENMGRAEKDALVKTAHRAASFRDQARAMFNEVDDSSSEA